MEKVAKVICFNMIADKTVAGACDPLRDTQESGARAGRGLVPCQSNAVAEAQAHLRLLV